MVRSLHNFFFASSREGRRSGKVSLVVVISKDTISLPTFACDSQRRSPDTSRVHVNATPQVREQSEHVLVGVINGKLERLRSPNESGYVP